jgi:hypothetical protein
MNDLAVNRTPSLKAVMLEQLRTVGLTIRREALLAGVLMGLPWLIVVVLMRMGWVVSDGHGWDTMTLDPGNGFAALAALVSVVFTWLVWRSESPFGKAAFWLLPVDHRRHAVIRIAAGWVWLMVFIGAVWSWIVLMTAATGSVPGVDVTRVLILDPEGAAQGAAGATELVRWVTPSWQWILPFTIATVGYLAVTALIVGTRWPLVWGVALWMLLALSAELSGELGVAWTVRPYGTLAQALGEWSGLQAWATLATGSGSAAWGSRVRWHDLATTEPEGGRAP